MPLHKSDEGWLRFQERTSRGARAHRAFMEHSPRRSFVRRTVNPEAPIERPSANESMRFRGRRRFSDLDD